MIYFLQAKSGGPIKIGYAGSKDGIEERRRALQTGSPDPLVVLGTMEGDMDVERKLHKSFKSERIGGEWFRPCFELRRLAKDPANIARVRSNPSSPKPQPAANRLVVSMAPIAMKRQDAARALSMSDESFDRYVRPDVKVIRVGALVLYPVAELERWAREAAGQTLPDG